MINTLFISLVHYIFNSTFLILRSGINLVLEGLMLPEFPSRLIGVMGQTALISPVTFKIATGVC